MIEGQTIKNRRSSYRSKFLQFQKSMFNIVNTSSMLALRPQSRARRKDNDSCRIMGTIHNPKSINQLWILKFISTDKYELINYATDQVIDTEDQVTLQRGKDKWTQRIQIEQMRNSNNQVKFRDYYGSYLTLDGILTLSKEKYYDELQRFFLIPVQDPYSLQCFMSSYTIMKPPHTCLDLANGNKQPGKHIILFQANNRSNQRWIIDPPLSKYAVKDEKNTDNSQQKEGYRIQNFLSKLYLNVDKDNNIFQQNTESLYMWKFINQTDQQYKIFCLKNQMYLESSEDNRLTFRSSKPAKNWILVHGMM